MIESPKSKRVSKYKGAEAESQAKIVNLVPWNDNQKLYIDALKTKKQIIVLGPSGTGKTYVAATMAANMYANKQIDKIIITRPAVSVGKSLGALPGDLGEKFGPWLYPVLSVLEEQLGKGVVDTAVKSGNIQMAPLEYMRGSSFKDAFVLADECFKGDTEVLTSKGFVPFSEYSGEQVVQFDGKHFSFVEPLRTINKPYSGLMAKISNQRFSMEATANHRAIYEGPSGITLEAPFQKIPSKNWKVPTTTKTVVKGSWNAKVALACALQADGSYLKTTGTSGNDFHYWTITVSRKSKIERLTKALEETGTKHSVYKEDKQGRVRFYIPDPDVSLFADLKTKTFSFESILLQGVGADLFEECFHWDGSLKGVMVYCSTNKANIDVIQALAHLCGYTTNYGVTYDKREIFKVTPKPYYRLNVTKGRSIGLQKAQHELYHYEDNVYCVTVPSGMIVVRQGNSVFITGNCQNLDIAQFKMLVTRIGENCKLVMNGDIRQSDIKDQTSGLGKALHLAKKYAIDASIIEFGLDDVVRSEICKQWLTAFYEEGL